MKIEPPNQPAKFKCDPLCGQWQVPSTHISQKRSGSGWTVEARWVLDDILEDDRKISLKCMAQSEAYTSANKVQQEDTLNVVVLSE